MDEKQLQEMMDEVTRGKEFSEDQTEEIRKGFENGLSMEQVQLFADPKFDSRVISSIERCFEAGLSMEQVSFCIDTCSKWEKKANKREEVRRPEEVIDTIRMDIQRGIPLDIIELYAGRSYGLFSIYDDIREDVLKKRFPEEQIRMYANLELNQYQAEQIRDAFEHDKLSTEQVKVFAKPEFDSRQMYHIRRYIRNLSQDQIDILVNPKFDCSQMMEIHDGFMHGLTVEQVKAYAKSEFDCAKMKLMRAGAECGVSFGTGYDNRQVDQIEKGIRNGLSIEQIQFYADPNFTADQMYQIREGFKDGLSMEQIQTYANHEFNSIQMNEIKRGFLSFGFTTEQVQFYADPKFDWTQMREIREGIRKGLPIEQIQIYADPKFDDNQMEEIRKGFESGVTVEQMKQVLGIVDERPSVSEKLDSMDHTPCTTTNNQNRDETVK